MYIMYIYIYVERERESSCLLYSFRSQLHLVVHDLPLELADLLDAHVAHQLLGFRNNTSNNNHTNE